MKLPELDRLPSGFCFALYSDNGLSRARAVLFVPGKAHFAAEADTVQDALKAAFREMKDSTPAAVML